jgi:hypothetical protein
METHTIHSELLRRRVRVLVVGCEGTGSAVAAGLPYLHHYVEFEVKENPRAKRDGPNRFREDRGTFVVREQ